MLKQDNYIRNLIAQGEHLQQDFKFEISDSRKIARSLVAFANTAGGKLLIGVKDNGAIAGVRSDEEFYMVEAAANMYSQPEIIFKTKEWKVEGKIVLEIDINKSDKMPHYAKNEEGKWLAYIRTGDKNLLVNRIQLQVWKREKFGKPVFIEFRENERLLFDYLDRKKEISLPKLLKLTRMKKQDAEQLLIDLILLQIIEIEFREQITVYKFKEGFDKILEDMRY
ncbi:MAG: ATP-binding protein [Bacteroidales bacterium]|nr:ATP-binding protein [Bacteroidales bacterium]